MPWPFLKRNRREVNEWDKRRGWEGLGGVEGEGEGGRERARKGGDAVI